MRDYLIGMLIILIKAIILAMLVPFILIVVAAIIAVGLMITVITLFGSPIYLLYMLTEWMEEHKMY